MFTDPRFARLLPFAFALGAFGGWLVGDSWPGVLEAGLVWVAMAIGLAFLFAGTAPWRRVLRVGVGVAAAVLSARALEADGGETAMVGVAMLVALVACEVLISSNSASRPSP